MPRSQRLVNEPDTSDNMDAESCPAISNLQMQDSLANDPDLPAHNDEFNVITTKSMLNQNKRIKLSIERSGFIETIELYDFMCHRHLLVRLLPGINFIYGNNGSGKSAILTALTVCLGGRASATQRATSLSGLIREGASEARIIITINNAGRYPFAPTVYGDKIVVERKLTREKSSASRYVLYGSDRKIVSEKKEEMLTICDHFCIQVDNPLAVLTQETAKRFLATARPKEFYDFFMRATHLEQLAIDYSYTLEKILDADFKLVTSRKSQSILAKEIQELDNTLKELEKLKDAHRRIQMLRCQLTWAIVQQAEREHEEQTRNLETCLQTEVLLYKTVQEYTDKLDQINHEIASIESQLTHTQERIAPLEHEHSELTTSINKTNSLLKDLKLEANEMNKEFKSLKQRLESIEEKISKDGRQDKDNVVKEKKLRRSELEKTLQDLSQNFADARSNEQTLRKERDTVSIHLSNAQEKLDEATRRFNQQQQVLNQLQNAQKDRARMFGDNLANVLKEIRALKWGKHAPIGPLGLHISLKDQRWSLAIEAILGKQLEAFLVNGHADRERLQKLLQKHNCYNPIIVLGFDNCKSRGLENQLPVFESNYTTALKVLEIDNPVVFKAIIITCSVERILLVQDRQEAFEIVRSNNLRRQYDAIYTTTHRVVSNTLGTLSYQALYGNPRTPKIFKDRHEVIQSTQNTITTLIDLKKICERDLAELSTQIRDIEAKQSLCSNQLESLDRSVYLTKKEMFHLDEELVFNTMQAESILENERQSLQESLEMITNQFNDNNDRQDQISKELLKFHDQTNELANQITELREENSKLRKLFAQKFLARKDADQAKELETKKLVTEQQKILQLQATVDAQLERVRQMQLEAEKLCPRIPVEISIKELDRNLSALEARLGEEKGAQLDPNRVKETLDIKLTSFHQLEAQLSQHSAYLDGMKKALEIRRIAWEDFRSSVAKNSNIEFIFMMNARGFIGQLEYHHREKELHIRVRPPGQLEERHHYNSKNSKDGSRQNGQLRSLITKRTDSSPDSRDIRQLSGGEKSYSTACFLISLWNSMGSPIRCLDEFDVFMDPVNRKYILDLLISHARTTGVQFLLITPISVTNIVKSAKDVRIIKLRDPERAQGIIQ